MTEESETVETESESVPEVDFNLAREIASLPVTQQEVVRALVGVLKKIKA